MQPARAQPRAPGSFSPLPGTAGVSGGSGTPPRPPPPRRGESSDSEDNVPSTISVPKSRAVAAAAAAASSTPGNATPIYAQFTSQANGSQSSLQNFSRPNLTVSPAAAVAARASSNDRAATASPLTPKGHVRKHSHTQGHFEPTLPSTSTSNLPQVSMVPPAAQIAAQAAVLQHQGSMHMRQRSQTVPVPTVGEQIEGARRGSASKGPLSPPMLSLTEASAPRESGFGAQGYHNGLLGSHQTAAATAANVVFSHPRSGQTSPSQPMGTPQQPPPPPPPPPPPAEKQAKPEKSKVKLFSRPGKIGTKGEPREKPLASPSKIGTALSNLQRGNFSSSSLVDSSGQSLYTLANSSSATIRAVETPIEDKVKEKEKKHHFLSRQKHKLSGKDDYHLSLSSAASNSKPTDPSAPSSLYNFHLPQSPGPTSTTFAKNRRDKKRDERAESRLDNESTFNLASDWAGPGSAISASSMYGLDPPDSGKYGLNNMGADDAWPYLKAKLLVIFEGEDLRLPVEDFNRIVNMHIRYCIERRAPNIIVEDFRDLLATGFASLDQTLRKTSEDRVIPALVELWLFTFTSILPYLQAVFLPLDLEFSGCGQLMTPEHARDFWGGVLATSPSADKNGLQVNPASSVLDVRWLVLTAYRDIVILPRYESLKTIFSRLSLEFLPSSLASMALASPLPLETHLSSSPSDSFSIGRPGTAMSLDPSVASYNSSSTTLLGEGSAGSRSRAFSNVSYGSGASEGGPRPFTPSSSHILAGSIGSLREQNVEDSKQVTEMIGRMLQCMSVLAGVGVADGDGDQGNRKMEELCKLLKLNWLGRGRTGRNRRGIVGGRVRREEVREEIRVL